MKIPPIPVPLHIEPLGEAALLCRLPAPATLAMQRRIWSMAGQIGAWVREHRLPVQEIVPGMNNLLVRFDPLRLEVRQLRQRLRAVWRQSAREAAQLRMTGQQVDIPVHYGGPHGPDLDFVARHAGLSPQRVVQRHCAAEYIVYFLGFQPGFAYLGGLDSSLATPRRTEPRLSVPAGSVAIGGVQTAIYPAATPGGWQIIGHTARALFDPQRDPPTLLLPGDTVRFQAVSIEEGEDG